MRHGQQEQPKLSILRIRCAGTRLRYHDCLKFGFSGGVFRRCHGGDFRRAIWAASRWAMKRVLCNVVLRLLPRHLIHEPHVAEQPLGLLMFCTVLPNYCTFLPVNMGL